MEWRDLLVDDRGEEDGETGECDIAAEEHGCCYVAFGVHESLEDLLPL